MYEVQHDPSYTTGQALADLERVARELAAREGDDNAQGNAADILQAVAWFKRDEMVISFTGEAWESFQTALNERAGYGVTITRLDGSEVEAVLLGADSDAEDGATVAYYPVGEDGDYPEVAVIYALHADEIVSEVVRRVEVS